MRTTKLLQAGQTALLLAALTFTAACGRSAAPGEVYAKSGSEVRQILSGMDTLPPIFGSAAIDTSVLNNGDGTITWTASQEFKPLLRFVATTEEVDVGQTRVTLAIKGPTDATDDATAKRFAENPTVRDLYLKAMTEQVDATLEGRNFDFSAISTELAMATAANIGSISAQMDEAAEEYRRRDAENVVKAYEQEANGGWETSDDW